MEITPIACLKDNYAWSIERADQTIIVDPGEAEPILTYLKNNQMNLQAILITHGHEDHYGGLKEMIDHLDQPIPVYGPSEVADLVNYVVKDEDLLDIEGLSIDVLETAGHSFEHVSYLIENHLFCGDALFSAGCGRVFTGDYKNQYLTLQKIAALPDETQIYAGHEYTLTNLEFALSRKPHDPAIQDYYLKVIELEKNGQATLPTSLALEKEVNLFLKAEDLEAFTQLRKARDQF